MPSDTNFYIGRLGYGTNADLKYFNGTAATAVTPGRTYAYWGLQGPAIDPRAKRTTATASAWGIAQANAFHEAWHANIHVGSRTLFGDVETGMGGWTSDPNLNYAVYTAFMNTLRALNYTAGVYSSPDEWLPIMGSTNATATPATVAWLASWLVDSTSPPPSAPMSFSPPGAGSFGGINPTIWHYYGSNTQDLNVATSLPA